MKKTAAASNGSSCYFILKASFSSQDMSNENLEDGSSSNFPGSEFFSREDGEGLIVSRDLDRRASRTSLQRAPAYDAEVATGGRPAVSNQSGTAVAPSADLSRDLPAHAAADGGPGRSGISISLRQARAGGAGVAAEGRLFVSGQPRNAAGSFPNLPRELPAPANAVGGRVLSTADPSPIRSFLLLGFAPRVYEGGLLVLTLPGFHRCATIYPSPTYPTGYCGANPAARSLHDLGICNTRLLNYPSYFCLCCGGAIKFINGVKDDEYRLYLFYVCTVCCVYGIGEESASYGYIKLEAPFDFTTNMFNGDFAMDTVQFCAIRHTCEGVKPAVHYLQSGFSFDDEPIPHITWEDFESYSGECVRRTTRSGKVLPNLVGWGGRRGSLQCHRCNMGCQEHTVWPFSYLHYQQDVQYIFERREDLWGMYWA